VRRVLLSPRWLLGHLLVIAAAATCLALGWWQWERSHAAGGNMQNLGYALQWPMFAIFGLVAWWRIIQLELHPPPDKQPRANARRPGPAPTELPTAAQDGDDEELAAYNRYLASLHAQDRAQEHAQHRAQSEGRQP
jgi:DNA-binding transcriptional regulator of glucitol operon